MTRLAVFSISLLYAMVLAFGAALSTPGTLQACRAEGTVASSQKKDTEEGEKEISKGDERKHGRKEQKMSIYEFTAKALDGSDISMDKYKGDVMLIVNTASECGFTPQYKGLEELHKKYSDKGLRILGFPCNQFGGQEPGDNNHIATFCQRNYGVDFQMFDKIDVNGKNAHPLFKYLTNEAPGALGLDSVKWNFTKFLVSRDGKVLKRYAPTVKPEDIAGDIEKQL